MKILRTWIITRANSLLGKCHKRKRDESAWELSVAQKSEPVLRGTLLKDILLILVFFFSLTNLAFKFNKVLVEPFSPQVFNFLPFHIIWNKVFKNGPSKICGRGPLKNVKE